MYNEYIIRLVTDINQVCRKYISKKTTLEGLDAILTNNATVMDNADRELRDILIDYSRTVYNIRFGFKEFSNNFSMNDEIFEKQYIEAVPIVMEIMEYTEKIIKQTT